MDDATDINVNTARFDAQDAADEVEYTILQRFAYQRHLETLEEREKEERCFRTFVLAESAREFGLKLNWPTDAWNYEKMLWKSTQGHRCVRPACAVTELPQAAPTLHNGHLYRRLFMHSCSRRLCLVCCDDARTGAREGEDAAHECSCRRCAQFELRKGTTYDDPQTGEKHTSSGTIFVCRETGAVHYCPEDSHCDRTYINTNDRRQGYVCRITTRYKGTAVSRIPEYDEERKIATSRINKMKEAETRQEEDGNCQSEEEYDDDDGFDYDEEDDNAEDLAEDAEFALQRDEYGAEEPLSGDNAKLEHDFFQIDDLQRMRRYAKLSGVDDILDYVTELNRIKRKASPVTEDSPSKRQRKPRTPRPAMTADERSEHYLKNPEDRAKRIHDVFRLLTDNQNKILMYKAALQDLAKEANERVDSAKRKNVARELSSIECAAIWYSYVIPRLPPVPELFEKPLDAELFERKIENAWRLAAGSPFGTEPQQNGRKRVLNIVKIAFGVLYLIADDRGYRLDCSLNKSVLREGEYRVGDVKLTKFKIRVLPASKLLPRYIISHTDLPTLHALVRNRVAFSEKSWFEGVRLFKTCVNSKHEVILNKLINALEQSDSDREQCLRDYIEECRSMIC